MIIILKLWEATVLLERAASESISEIIWYVAQTASLELEWPKTTVAITSLKPWLHVDSYPGWV